MNYKPIRTEADKESITQRIQAARTPLTPYTFGTAYDNAQERLQALKTAKRGNTANGLREGLP